MKIAVIGIAQTAYDEFWDKDIYDLLSQSQLDALSNAGISSSDVDAIFTGNMCAGSFGGQRHLGAVAAEILNVNVPSMRVEGACASGALAISSGIAAIQSGQAEVVVVNGVEKMSDVNIEQATTALMGAGFLDQELFAGASFPGLFALISRLYMNKFGVTREQLAHVSVKSHKNGMLNPHAFLRKAITVDDVLKASMVADPLSLFDCSPMCDGAASLVLSTPEFAKKKGLSSIYIVASATAMDCVGLGNRSDLTSFDANKQAAQKAYKMAGITSEDIDVIELHDAFSMSEIIALEDLGFFEKGTAVFATVDGKTEINSMISVNPSGGLKAKGHPVGATGVGQAVEIVKQLRGDCGDYQIKDARIGLAHNMGGAGTTVVVHIFSREG